MKRYCYPWADQGARSVAFAWDRMPSRAEQRQNFGIVASLHAWFAELSALGSLLGHGLEQSQQRDIFWRGT